MSLHQGKLDIRKRFFTERVVGHWNRLNREVVTPSSLSEFKEHLDDALKSYDLVSGSPARSRELQGDSMNTSFGYGYNCAVFYQFHEVKVTLIFHYLKHTLAR